MAATVNDDHNHLVVAIMEAQNSLFFGGFVFVAVAAVA
jgi:hypothetical protein